MTFVRLLCTLLTRTPPARPRKGYAMTVTFQNPNSFVKLICVSLAAMSWLLLMPGQSARADTSHADAYMAQAWDLYNQGQPGQAMPLAQKALEELQLVLEHEHPKMAEYYYHLGLISLELDDKDQAMRHFSEALLILETLGAEPDRISATCLFLLSEELFVRGEVEHSINMGADAIEHWEAVLDPDAQELAYFNANFGRRLMKFFAFKEAQPFLEKALDILQQGPAAGGAEVASLIQELAFCHLRQGDPFTAKDLYFQALNILKTVHGNDHPLTAMCLDNMGRAYFEAGDFAAAVEVHEQALAVLEAGMDPGDPHLAVCNNNLGEALAATGQCQEALPHFERALEIEPSQYNPAFPPNYFFIANMAFCHEDLGNADQAGELMAKARELQCPGCPLERMWPEP